MNKDLKVMLISSLGMMLEYYDFVIYIMILPVIVELFFHSSGMLSIIQAYTVFAVGYFVRPLGGIIIGHFGDKIGRKNTFIFTIFLMTFSTFFIASLPAYGTFSFLGPSLLIFFRVCQGIAYGGELPAATTFVYEHMPNSKKLFGCAVLFVGSSIGILLAIAVFTVITRCLSHQNMLIWGWRLPFLLSFINGVLGLYIIFKFTDTPEFIKIAEKHKQLKIPFLSLIMKFTPETIIGFFLNLGGTVLYSVFCLLMPTILNVNYNYPLSFSYNLTMMFVIIFTVFTLFWSWIITMLKLNVKVVYFICTVFTGILTPFVFYTFSIHLFFGIIAIYTLIAIFFGCLNAVVPYVISQLFPTEVRLTGFATSYNFASAIAGGLTPIVVTLALKKYSPTYALPVLIIFAVFCILLSIMVLMARNKQGKSLYE